MSAPQPRPPSAALDLNRAPPSGTPATPAAAGGEGSSEATTLVPGTPPLASEARALTRLASASPPSAPEPSKVTRSPTEMQSSKSDSLKAEKALADLSTPRPLPPIEADSVRDYFGLGSFSLGSYAFLVAVLMHERFLTLGFGLAGLLCGVIGLYLSLSKQQVSVLASAGLIVNLPPVLVALLAPGWLGIHI